MSNDLSVTAGSQRPQVLVVDDDAFTRAYISSILKGAEIDVVAVDVGDALSMIADTHFDLVIADRSMPGVSGDEFLAIVRSDPTLDLTPFLFLTASDDVEHLIGGLDGGADDYITKPFRPEELVARVKNRLARIMSVRRREDQALVDVESFAFELDRELSRASHGGQGGLLAVVNLPSLKSVEAILGDRERRDFVGIFDADHHPNLDVFHRAWRWLSNGYSAVQGHCLVRNGEDSFLARMVAVEFESIYAVSHPGRYRRDHFGIFGGSNGFWRTDALHLTRMRGSMLTEDIDASMRLLEAGGLIGSDPQLISRELGTTTVRQIWNQRLRWAQGWFQVSIRHVFKMLRMPHFSLRQKLGIFNLLLQREIYPWISLQIFPLVAFWIFRGDDLNWLVPVFVAATIFTATVGPGSVLFAYRLAHPEIKQHRAWFWQYLFFSLFVYTEAKNVIGRVTQLKQAMGETSWRVTPRSADPAMGVPMIPIQPGATGLYRPRHLKRPEPVGTLVDVQSA